MTYITSGDELIKRLQVVIDSYVPTNYDDTYKVIAWLDKTRNKMHDELMDSMEHDGE